MKRIIFNEPFPKKVINFELVDKNVPIFVKRDNKLYGFVVHERSGWIVRIGGKGGSHGYFPTLERLLTSKYSVANFTFHVN